MTFAPKPRSHSHTRLNSTLTWIVVGVTAALSYLVPKLVAVLASNPQTVWPLWPGCAIVVTGLLLVRVNVWPVLIPASFAGFALADLQAGRPLSSIAWFIPGNTIEVLIVALGLRYCFDGVPRLNSVQALAKYSVFAVVLGPLAGAFFSAYGVVSDYWTGWKIVFLSEVLAFITVTPALLSWISDGRVLMRRSRAFHLEGAMLVTGLIFVSYIVFTLPEDSRSPALFYTLVPFLLWSALRFGWLGVSTSLIVVTSLSIWGAVYGRGPFSNLVPLTKPLPLQMFLVFAAIPFMILAVLSDESEQAANVVRESEERFRLVSNTAPVMIWMSGTDKLCTYFNKPWLDFTGRSMEEELGNRWAEGVHPEDLLRCTNTYTQSFDKREKFGMEYRLRRHDGEYRWILDIGVPRFQADGSFAGYIGSCLDITDRKLAEEAVSKANERLRLALEAGSAAGWDYDLKTGKNVWFGTTHAQLGMTADETSGSRKEFWDRIHEDDRERVAHALQVAKEKREEFAEDVRVVWRDGTTHWLRSRGRFQYDANGEAERSLGISLDITERKMAEQRLREYEKAVESAEDMIGVIDREYRFLLANRQYLTMRNLTREQVVGHVIPDVMNSELFETVVRPKLDECFQGKVVRYEMKFSYPIVGERDLLISYFPIEGVNGVDRAACILRDVTERKRAEEALSGMTRKLVEAQEQERARIARELHDDINQRLALLAIELDQLKENPSEVGDRAQELRKQMTEIANGVQALSHDLHSTKLEYLGVVAGMKSWCKEFAGRQKMDVDFKSDVRSLLSLDVGRPLFRVLQEALYNAFKHSGVKRVEVQLREEPDEIHLIVRDLGRGFDVEAALHGKGLGLTSMRERVRLMNGTIVIDAKPMGGTTIHVCIPLESNQAQRAAG